MRRRTRILSLIALAVLCAASAAYVEIRRGLYAPPAVMSPPVPGQQAIHFAFDQGVDADGIPVPWLSRAIRGTLHVDLVDGPDGPTHKALHLHCDQSHFLVYNAASPFDPNEYPVIEWKWKATVLPTRGDIRKQALVTLFGAENRNDSAVQVLIGFEGNFVLSYVWDTSAPVGTEVSEPSPVATIRTRVVESGPDHLNQWLTYRTNIVDDYRKRYGKDPGKVLGVSIQTNSNHTSSIGDGIVSQITALSK